MGIHENFRVSRRGVLAGTGALVVSFSIAARSCPGCRAGDSRTGGAGAAEAPGQPRRCALSRFLDPHRCRRRDHRLHRQGGARPGHPHRADPGRGGGAGRGARRHQPHHRRYRPDARRGLHRRQPVDAEQRHGDPQRGGAGARDPLRRGRAPAGRGAVRIARRGQGASPGRADRSAMASWSPPSFCMWRRSRNRC